MILTELLQDLTKIDSPKCDIRGIENDSRNIKAGDLFIAYPGAASDGRNYISQAEKAGAVAVLYDPQNDFSPAKSAVNIPCIAIENLANRLGEIASKFYQYPEKSITITAVTGTNGKTSIAYQLAQAHVLLGHKAAYIGTIGQGDVEQLEPLANTTPDALCLQKLLYSYQTQGIKHVCMEVSSHALSQHRVDGIPFSQAIYTNLSHDHLDYHHSMEDYAAAKARLFATPGLECAIVNSDDDYCDFMLSSLDKDSKILSYGIHKPANIKVSDWHMDMKGTRLTIDTPWGQQQLKLQSLGEFNISNGLAIFTSLMAAGYSVEKVVDVMAKLHAAPGRLEVVWQNPLIVVDYAHTPDALKNVLITLNQLKKGHLAAVFGCGGDRDKSKRAVMGEVASHYADRVIITSDNPRTENPEDILNDIAKGSKNFIRESDRKKAIEQAIAQAGKDDIVLIAGKGHEDYQIIDQKKHPFSDQQIVKDYFKTL